MKLSIVGENEIKVLQIFSNLSFTIAEWEKKKNFKCDLIEKIFLFYQIQPYT